MQLIASNNNTSQLVLENGTINLGTIYRQYKTYNCNAKTFVFNGTSITLNQPGMYDIIVTATFTAPTAGNVTLQLKENGVAIPSTTATETITTTGTETRTLTLIYTSLVTQTSILNQISTLSKTISLDNTGIGATFTNVNIRVLKVV